MIIKNLIDEDFVNYHKPSMFIAMPHCSFKCDKECGRAICQNSALANEPNHNVSIDNIFNRYFDNPITKAIIFGGLEPFDSWGEVQNFIMLFRYRSMDDIVIYTGYTEEEIGEEQKDWLKLYAGDGDIIVKYGRYIPDQESHYDDILGVKLASPNQYAVRYTRNDYKD